MSQFIFFMIGAFVGAFIGVVMMCLLQISRTNDYYMEDNVDEQKKH